MEYVHADIKGSNILTGCCHPERVYLADYGLSFMYTSYGRHMEYKKKPGMRNIIGTKQFASIDAHDSVCKLDRWLCFYDYYS